MNYDGNRINSSMRIKKSLDFCLNRSSSRDVEVDIIHERFMRLFDFSARLIRNSSGDIANNLAVTSVRHTTADLLQGKRKYTINQQISFR